MAWGPFQILLTLVILSFVFGVVKRFRGQRGATLASSALVVKEVRVDEMQECQVKVVARKAGLLSFILALFGIDSTFTLQIYADRIESEEGSLSGRIRTMIPLTALDTYTSGYTKPIYLLVLAGFFVLAAFFSAFSNSTGSGVLALLFLVFAGLCVLFFYLRKCFLLAFTTNGSNGIAFLFKRSVIEGVNVDETLAERIGELVKRNYLAQARK